jgi:RNA-directed DNA polymerase
MESITQFISTRLKLKVNREKSAVAPPQERKFLGFSFTGEVEPRRRIAPKAVKRFKERVREITRRRKGDSVGKRVEELRRYLTGWRGYFGFCQTPSVLAALDSWVRRRLRCIFWIQWKTGRRRFEELHRRGVERQLAANSAGSNHGPWRMSVSKAVTAALSNAFFDSLGLPRLAAGR